MRQNRKEKIFSTLLPLNCIEKADKKTLQEKLEQYNK